MDSPLVSIVIPTKNRRVLLEETLESVRSQTYRDWEAIVVDDESEDDTAAFMEKVCAEDSRIRYVRRRGNNANANVCRNQGIDESKGEYIIFLDSDDILAPDCLEVRVTEMNNHPDLAFIACLGQLFESVPGDSDLLWNIFTPDSDLDRFLTGRDSPWQTTGPIWRRSVFENVRWDEDLLSWQDGDFHIRVLARGLPYGRVNAPDYFIRRGTNFRSAISQTDKNAKHLINHTHSFQKISKELKEWNHFTPRTKKILGALFYLKCKELIKIGCVAEAISSWNLCYESDCCGLVRKLEGVAVFSLCRVPRLRSRLLNSLDHRWKDLFVHHVLGTGRKIYRNTRTVRVV